jgi:antitoxin CptB
LSLGGTDAAELGRLRWRCRRGMRELDELLTNYLTEQFPGASPAERAAFARLLDAPDDAIQAYCLRQRQPESPALQALVARITTRSFCER